MAKAVRRKRGRHILYVIASLDLGGAERHIMLLAPRISALGWRPTVYCVERRGRQADAMQAAGVRVIGPPSEVPEKRGSLAGRVARLALSSIKLLGLYLTQRPHITHFFLPVSYLIGGPLAILARIPVRIMSRRSLNLYQRDRLFARSMEMRLHPHMSRILANSRSVSRQLIEDEGVDPERVDLIYNGVDLDGARAPSELAEAPQPYDAGAPITLIIVANLIPYKGHADLFRALAIIAASVPPWRLLCVGRDDGCGSELARIVGDLGLQDHVQFLGERTDVPVLLQGADIGILCSHQEGFSNAVLEGMAASLPMVVTDVGGNAEAVVDGETGLVVPARDPNALGAAIAALAKDQALRRRMGAAGQERAEKLFSLDACVTRYDRLYRSLIGETVIAEDATPKPVVDEVARDD